jgi:hypothetical protein
LTFGQTRKINFTLEQLKKQELEIDAHIKLGSDTLIKDLMLPYIAGKLTLQKSACALYAAQLDLSLDSGTLIGTFTELLAPFKELKTNSAEVLASSSRCMSTALVEAKCVKRKLEDGTFAIVKKVDWSQPSEEPKDKKTKRVRNI